LSTYDGVYTPVSSSSASRKHKADRIERGLQIQILLTGHCWSKDSDANVYNSTFNETS
jgi:hypothetical protein